MRTDAEQKCRELAKEKGIRIIKRGEIVYAYYIVTIRQFRRHFYSWEDLLQWLETIEGVSYYDESC